jgi:hypothetical protein
MMSAGHPDPLKLIPQETMFNLAEQARGSLSEALRLGNEHLEKLLEDQKSSLRMGIFPSAQVPPSKYCFFDRR